MTPVTDGPGLAPIAFDGRTHGPLAALADSLSSAPAAAFSAAGRAASATSELAAAYPLIVVPLALLALLVLALATGVLPARTPRKRGAHRRPPEKGGATQPARRNRPAPNQAT